MLGIILVDINQTLKFLGIHDIYISYIMQLITVKENTLAIDEQKVKGSASTTERSSFRSPGRSSAGLNAEAAAALTSMGQSFPERCCSCDAVMLWCRAASERRMLWITCGSSFCFPRLVLSLPMGRVFPVDPISITLVFPFPADFLF